MKEWTEEELAAQGYFMDRTDDPLKPTATDRRVNSNAAHRESLLPCSGSAGQPLAPKEPVQNPTETERLCRDPEEWARMLEARKAAGLLSAKPSDVFYGPAPAGGITVYP